MLIHTRIFGDIEIDPAKKIIFKKGLLGFEDLKEYILIEDAEEGSPFAYLQSIENPEICFTVANPYVFIPEYAPDVKEEYIERLGGGTAEDFSVLVVVSIPTGFHDATINLVGPLVIHNGTRLGEQVILENTSYTTRHLITELLLERRDNDASTDKKGQ